MKTSIIIVFFLLIAVGLYVVFGVLSNEGATKSYSSEVVQEWIDLILVLTKETPGFSPPVSARAFGYTGVSLYESVRFGIPGSKSLAGQVNGFNESILDGIDSSGIYNWNIVANANLAEILRNLYSNTTEENKEKINILETYLLERYSKDINDDIVIDSIKLGVSVARGISEYANSDGQKNGYLSNFSDTYIPKKGEGMWVPTPEQYQKAMHPYWGEVRPFLSDNIKDTLPIPPPEYSLDGNSQFFIETKEVYDTIQNLTEEELTIAEFWSDDPGKTATPPGHSISILRQILAKENSSLDEAAISFAKLGMGVHDAFIACWYAKYEYNLIRPITVIREHIDSSFTIPLNTPPFPEYPSGHSVQSGASAQILTDIFGKNYKFVDETHKKRTDIDGTPRNFDSFYLFADEAAISRLYGGIHYRAAIELGVEQGKEIGKNIGKILFF